MWEAPLLLHAWYLGAQWPDPAVPETVALEGGSSSEPGFL